MWIMGNCFGVLTLKNQRSTTEHCFNTCVIELTVPFHFSVPLGPYSLSGKASCSKISRSLEATRCGFSIFQSAEMPVKFQSDAMIMTSNLMASKLHEILQ